IVPTLQCGFVLSNFSFDMFFALVLYDCRLCLLSATTADRDVAPAGGAKLNWRLPANPLERVRGIEPPS
ncbi:MAG: hypothetical protein VW516_14735, partial [Rhodospirillaceae bacterium]